MEKYTKNICCIKLSFCILYEISIKHENELIFIFGFHIAIFYSVYVDCLKSEKVRNLKWFWSQAFPIKETQFVWLEFHYKAGKLGCGVEFAYLVFECSSLSKNLQYILGEQNFRAFPLLFILPRLSFCFSFLCFWSRILNINPSSISNPLSHPTWESLEQLISFLSMIQDRQWRIEYLN